MPRGLSLPGICHTEVATFWTQPVVPGSGFGKDSKGTDGCPAGLSAAAPPAAPPERLSPSDQHHLSSIVPSASIGMAGLA